MNVKFFGIILVALLIFSPDVSDAQWYGGRRGGYYGGGYGGRYHGRGRGRGRGRGIGRAIVRGAAVIGGLALLGAFLGKKKRSTDVYDEVESDPYEDALDSFDLAMELDDDMCMEKTLCDIMATSHTQKNPSTLLKILRTIYYGDMPLLGVEGHDDATKLLEAGLLGKSAKTEEVCRIAFKTCKKSPETLKKELKEAYDNFGNKQ